MAEQRAIDGGQPPWAGYPGADAKQRHEAAQLRGQGWTFKQIAERFGWTSDQAQHRVTHYMEWQRRQAQQAASPAQDAGEPWHGFPSGWGRERHEAARLRAAGWPWPDIAARVGWTREQTRARVATYVEWRRQRGLPPVEPAEERPPNKSGAGSPGDPDALSDEEIQAETQADLLVAKARAGERYWRRKYDELLKRASFIDQVCDAIREVVPALEPISMPKGAPAVLVRKEWVPVCVISDIHAGEVVDPAKTGGMGGYNSEIMVERGRNLLRGVSEALEYYRDFGMIRRMYVPIIGDVTTGTKIYRGQSYHIEFGHVEQAIRVADLLVEILLGYLELPGIEEIEVECVPGNHGRLGLPGQDPYEDNMDLVAYEFVRQKLSHQPRVKVTWHKTWWFIRDILGWKFHFSHGEDVRAWLQIPHYGLHRAAANETMLLKMYEMGFNYKVIGHHHVAYESDIPAGAVIINGNWVGTTPFTAKVLRTGGPANQMFFCVSEDDGIEWRYRIRLDRPKSAAPSGVEEKVHADNPA